MIDAYQRISQTLPSVEELQLLPEATSAVFMLLATYLDDIFVFHSRLLQYLKGSGKSAVYNIGSFAETWSVWKHLFQSTWKQFHSGFVAELEQMRYRKTLVETRASSMQFLQARQLHLRMIAESKSQIQSDSLQQKRSVAEWLAPANVEIFQKAGREARQQSSGSGEWLLTRDVFRSWCHPASIVTPLLWITGIPGAGGQLRRHAQPYRILTRDQARQSLLLS